MVYIVKGVMSQNPERGGAPYRCYACAGVPAAGEADRIEIESEQPESDFVCDTCGTKLEYEKKG